MGSQKKRNRLRKGIKCSAIKNHLMFKKIVWITISIIAAISLSVVVGIINPSEKVNALWLVVASGCFYVITYRFYASFLAAKVLTIDEKCITPAIRLSDGIDYYPTNRWILFGHHFAAIAGAGPLIGPMLAAQFGYLPGFLWILIGSTLGGAVHDMVILFASVRRDGHSLAQIARDEIGPVGGIAAAFAILFIITVALAGLGLAVVNALSKSRPCCGECVIKKSMGDIYHCPHHPYCILYGNLPLSSKTRKGR